MIISPHEEAARSIRGKLPVTRRIWDAMGPELRGASFSITGVEDLHAIERVRNLVAQVPEGTDWDETKDAVAAELVAWLDDEEASERRAELILRSHGYAAYSKSNFEALEAESDIFTWRKYQTAQDELVRGSHAALDGLILPADSPFWIDHTPPWEFGCRCDAVGMTDEDVEEIRFRLARNITPIERPKFMIVDRGAELAALEAGHLYRDGVMNFVARNPDGFRFDPRGGIVTVDMLQGLRKRVGPKVWDGFADWARNAEVPGEGDVWSYLTKPPRKKRTRRADAKLDAHRKQFPPVSAAFPTSGGAAVATVQRTLAAIEDVHGDGVLPPIRVTALPKGTNPGLRGKYVARAKRHLLTGQLYDWEADRISINMTGDGQELTAAHEIGHFLAAFALGTGEDAVQLGHGDASTPIGRWWQVASSSSAWQEIGKQPWSAKHVAYLQSPEETFARAYAQYVATRSRAPEAAVLRRQLGDKLAGMLAPTQWDDADFSPIADALDEILADKGWVRPRP